MNMEIPKGFRRYIHRPTIVFIAGFEDLDEEVHPFVAEWPGGRKFVKTIHGDRLEIEPGDYAVLEPDGKSAYPLKEHLLHQNYASSYEAILDTILCKRTDEIFSGTQNEDAPDERHGWQTTTTDEQNEKECMGCGVDDARTGFTCESCGGFYCNNCVAKHDPHTCDGIAPVRKVVEIAEGMKGTTLKTFHFYKPDNEDRERICGDCKKKTKEVVANYCVECAAWICNSCAAEHICLGPSPEKTDEDGRHDPVETLQRTVKSLMLCVQGSAQLLEMLTRRVVELERKVQ